LRPLFDAFVDQTIELLTTPRPLSRHLPSCHKAADDFPFSEELQDSFAAETGYRFSTVKMRKGDDPGRIIELRAPKTAAEFGARMKKIIAYLNKKLDRTTAEYCRLLIRRTLDLIIEISRLADDPDSYDEAVHAAYREATTAFTNLPDVSKQTFSEYFCVRRKAVDRTKYVTQLISV
ncbi:hypothetical protein PFISCL1PPCAC_13459, partial [Pristionchus fissidentatus]